MPLPLLRRRNVRLVLQVGGRKMLTTRRFQTEPPGCLTAELTNAPAFQNTRSSASPALTAKAHTTHSTKAPAVASNTFATIVPSAFAPSVPEVSCNPPAERILPAAMAVMAAPAPSWENVQFATPASKVG